MVPLNTVVLFIQVGMLENYLGILLPNLLQNMEIRGLVRSSFLSKMGPFNIFASMGKTFLTGKKTTLNLLRNGTVVENINVNYYLDPNYQYIKFNKDVEVINVSIKNSFFRKNIQIIYSCFKGDQLLFSCTYYTAASTLPIIGGKTLTTEQVSLKVYKVSFINRFFKVINKLICFNYLHEFQLYFESGKKSFLSIKLFAISVKLIIYFL